jgi:hypothetical protein
VGLRLFRAFSARNIVGLRPGPLAQAFTFRAFGAYGQFAPEPFGFVIRHPAFFPR